MAKTLSAMTGKFFLFKYQSSECFLLPTFIILMHSNHLFSETVNPVITVDVCGETKYTSAKEDQPTGSSKTINWKEHLFFEPRNRVSYHLFTLSFICLSLLSLIAL